MKPATKKNKNTGLLIIPDNCRPDERQKEEIKFIRGIASNKVLLGQGQEKKNSTSGITSASRSMNNDSRLMMSDQSRPKT